jgi:TatD DNase family protein
VIDTHAHLDGFEDADEVVERAREAGVTRIVGVGTGIDSCRATLELCDRHEGIYASLGIHPHSAGDATAADVDELRRLLGHPKAVAVGETGLDYYRDWAPRDRQAGLFRAQIALAAEAGKALVIHTRGAEEETVRTLTEAASGQSVVLHCFSSSSLLEPALEHGWYVSFAGNVTYPKAPELRWAAARARADRILAETDSPYLSPQPVRGRRNEPAHVVHTLATLAEAREEDVAELERALDANAAAVFGLP